jgi:hypothetical protein
MPCVVVSRSTFLRELLLLLLVDRVMFVPSGHQSWVSSIHIHTYTYTPSEHTFRHTIVKTPNGSHVPIIRELLY